MRTDGGPPEPSSARLRCRTGKGQVALRATPRGPTDDAGTTEVSFSGHSEAEALDTLARRSIAYGSIGIQLRPGSQIAK